MDEPGNIQSFHLLQEEDVKSSGWSPGFNYRKSKGPSNELELSIPANLRM
jgi:hypothetical protein